MSHFDSSYQVKPGKLTTISVLTLISGISNILAALILTGSIVLGTFGIGLLCAPVTLLPLVLGIFEIIFAAKLLANPPKPVNPSQALAILEICCILFGNIIALAAGIVALVLYSDAEVKQYFAYLNAGQEV